MAVIQCYVPTNAATRILESLANFLNHTLKRNIKIIMGDLNAKMGDENTG